MHHTTTAATLAEQILERPDAAMLFDNLRRMLENERKRRQEFYEWVTEDVKAEFINGQVASSIRPSKCGIGKPPICFRGF